MLEFTLRQVMRGFGLGLAFTAGLALAVPASATPPSHAPAHGWRRKHDPYYLGYSGRKWPNDYGISQGRCDRAAIGAVLGGAVGSAVGSQIGDGSGREVAIIVGTVLGAAIGHQIGRDMDESDRACVGHALELAKDGGRVRWTNAATGIAYVLTAAGPAAGGDACRAFTLDAAVGGRSRTTNGRACRTGDGTWRMRDSRT